MSPNRRRLLWVLLAVLGLHLLLLWRFAPALRGDRVASAPTTQPARPLEEAIDVAPPEEPLPQPPRSKGLTLATRLASGSLEQAVEPLPPGFFDQLKTRGRRGLKVSARLGGAPGTGAEAVAEIIPTALQLPALVALAPKPATPTTTSSAKPATPPRAFIVPPLTAATPVAPPPAAGAPNASASPAPFRLPPPDAALDEADIDAAIASASRSAERTARAANEQQRPRGPDLRALLPQQSILPPEGPTATPTPAPTMSATASSVASAPQWTPEEARRQQQARQQFFALLTARLKAANQLALAESVRAGARVTVRMAFVIDRSGRVVDAAAADETPPLLVERALRVLHKAEPLPAIPETMALETLELSFPVEVYR